MMKTQGTNSKAIGSLLGVQLPYKVSVIIFLVLEEKNVLEIVSFQKYNLF